jgi:hypothetical protein
MHVNYTKRTNIWKFLTQILHTLKYFWEFCEIFHFLNLNSNFEFGPVGPVPTGSVNPGPDDKWLGWVLYLASSIEMADQGKAELENIRKASSCSFAAATVHNMAFPYRMWMLVDQAPLAQEPRSYWLESFGCDWFQTIDKLTNVCGLNGQCPIIVGRSVTYIIHSTHVH